MQFDVLTIFPDIINHYAGQSILGKAQQKKLINIAAHDFRAFTKDKHKHVDDHPYGGGPGMILQVQPIFDCLKNLGVIKVEQGVRAVRVKKTDKKTRIIIMDPAGKRFNQRMVEQYAKLDRLVFISGRYEGFDERIYKLADEAVSVGDYVLAGGELPALTIVEAVSRLIPGVLGNTASLEEETFGKGRKASGREYPQYTRPEIFMGWKVPNVLLTGDHEKIRVWRQKHSR